jgi:hypothetical protein
MLLFKLILVAAEVPVRSTCITLGVEMRPDYGGLSHHNVV